MFLLFFSYTNSAKLRLIKVEIIKNMIDIKYDTKYNGGEKMSSWDKLLKRFLELDHDIRFEEIVKVMKEYGYEIKQPKGGSSHYSFVKSGCNRIVIPRHKPIKKVYVKMIKKVIEEEMKEYESRTQILHESVVSYGNC